MCMFSLRHALKFTSANRVSTPALAGRVVIQGHRWTRPQVPLTQGFEFSLEVLHITGPHTQKISAEDFHKCTQNFLTLRWVTVHDVYWTIFCVIVFVSPAVPACTSSRQLGLLTVDIPHRRSGREGGGGKEGHGTLTGASSLTFHPAVCNSAVIAHGPRKELEGSGWVRGVISHGAAIYTEFTSSGVTVCPLAGP